MKFRKMSVPFAPQPGIYGIFGRMHGKRPRASLDIPCSVNATFARKRGRSPQVLIIQESIEKKKSFSYTFPKTAESLENEKRTPVMK